MDKLRRILLVEDDPRDIELIMNAFTDCSLANEMAIAHDGVEALDYLYRRGVSARREEGNPAVIMLDLKLPRVDGLEVLRTLKSDEKLRCIPVVVMTSSHESSDLKECYQLGVNAYVVKPLKIKEFVEAIQKIGMFWALINEPPSGCLLKR